MRKGFLETLRCPYSGSSLRLVREIESRHDRLRYAVVAGEAGEFPVLEGILRLQVDEYRAPIVSYMRAAQTDRALRMAFDEVPFQGRAGAAINMMSRLAFKSDQRGVAEALQLLKRRLVRGLTDPAATFAETARRLAAGPRADWQIYRFSMPTFLATFPLLHAVRFDGPILDFCCGTGQASFLMTRLNPSAQITCVDYSFSSLYIARKYFVPDAECVSLDADYPLPFPSRAYATVFSSDALHWIDSKWSLAREFERVGRSDAVIIFPHLHNRLASQDGKALSPDGYGALFPDTPRRLAPEESLVRDYFFDDVLDLAREWSVAELQQATLGVSLIASTDLSAFKRTEGLWAQRLSHMVNPSINPAYEVDKRAHSWIWRRKVNGSFARTVEEPGMACLPDKYEIKVQSSDIANLADLKLRHPALFAQLAKAMLVVDLPSQFQ